MLAPRCGEGGGGLEGFSLRPLWHPEVFGSTQGARSPSGSRRASDGMGVGQEWSLDMRLLPPRPTGRVPFAGPTLPRCPGRLSEAPQPPRRTLPKALETRGGAQGGRGPGLPCRSCLPLQSCCQGQPERSPCNKPLHLPSSKDSFPICPPVCPPGSSLSVRNSVSLLFALGSVSFSCQHWEPGSIPLVWPVEIVGPKMGKGGAVRVAWSLALKWHAFCAGGTDRRGQMVAGSQVGPSTLTLG